MEGERCKFRGRREKGKETWRGVEERGGTENIIRGSRAMEQVSTRVS